jgi:large subunit ribosomal protein L24
MNRLKLHVHKGDQVEVIAGNFKGSSGRVLEVRSKKQRVIVEGVRMIKKHMRKSQDNPQGKIEEREGPIHISNVKVLEREQRSGKDAGKGAKAAPTSADKPKAAAKKASARKKASKEEA